MKIWTTKINFVLTYIQTCSSDCGLSPTPKALHWHLAKFIRSHSLLWTWELRIVKRKCIFPHAPFLLTTSLLCPSKGCQVCGGEAEAAAVLPSYGHEQSHPDVAGLYGLSHQGDPAVSAAFLSVSGHTHTHTQIIWTNDTFVSAYERGPISYLGSVFGVQFAPLFQIPLPVAMPHVSASHLLPGKIHSVHIFYLFFWCPKVKGAFKSLSCYCRNYSQLTTGIWKMNRIAILGLKIIQMRFVPHILGFLIFFFPPKCHRSVKWQQNAVFTTWIKSDYVYV